MKMNNIFILIYALGWVNAFYAYTNRASSGQRFSCDHIFLGKVQSMIGRSFLIYQPRGFNKMFIVCINNDTLIINNRECVPHIIALTVFHCVILCALLLHNSPNLQVHCYELNSRYYTHTTQVCRENALI